MNFSSGQVQEAMMQLVQNPVFRANPSCLGDFLENLVKVQKGESPVPSPQDPDNKPSQTGSDSGKRPLQNASDLTSEDGQNVEAYRCFWSKFKRPAQERPNAPGGEGSVNTTPTGVRRAMEVAVQPVVPEIAPTASVHEVSDPVEPAQPKAKVEAPASSGDAAGAEKDLEIMLRPGDGDDKVPTAAVSKQPKFTPQASDVHACLQRKTTLDMDTTMAPRDMPGHTAVVMDLAGVLQDVWIPLSPEDAVKAGLTLSPSVKVIAPTSSTSMASSKETVAASPNAEAAEVSTSESGKPATAVPPMVPTPASVPATPMVEAPTPETSAPAVPNPAGVAGQPSAERAPTEDDAEAQAKAALKNSYMRFHRSVNSNLT